MLHGVPPVDRPDRDQAVKPEHEPGDPVLTFPVWHTFMMNDRDVRAAVRRALEW